MATKTRKPKRRERVAKLARKYYGAVEIAERVGCAPATVYSDLRSLVHQTTKNLILSDNRRQAQAKGVPAKGKSTAEPVSGTPPVTEPNALQRLGITEKNLHDAKLLLFPTEISRALA